MNVWMLRGALALALVGGGFAAGWFAKPGEVITQTQVQQVEKVVTKVVKEKVTAPDGTVTEHEVTEIAKDAKTKSKAKAQVPIQAIVPKSQWSLGVKWKPRDDYYPESLEVGRRVLSTNLWTTVEYYWETKTVLLGVKYEL